jgi:hypothetical protein
MMQARERTPTHVSTISIFGFPFEFFKELGVCHHPNLDALPQHIDGLQGNNTGQLIAYKVVLLYVFKSYF